MARRGEIKDLESSMGTMQVLNEPKSVQDYLQTHPLSRGGRLWCDRILEGVDRRERHCLRMYAEVMKWVGAQGQLVVLMLQSHGIKSEAELGSIMTEWKNVASMDEHERYRLMREACLEYERKHPQRISGAVEMLAESNGGTNGTGADPEAG